MPRENWWSKICEWDSRPETREMIAYRSIPNVARLSVYPTLWSGFHQWKLFFASTDQKPSAQKYSGMYKVIEANSAIHSQMYSPARRSPGNWGLIQHQYWPEQCEQREEDWKGKSWITHRCRRFIIGNPCADGHPKRNENTSEAGQANGNATRF